MNMNDLCREADCKHVTWNTGDDDSCTAWLECKLHKEVTDVNHCKKCKERVPKRRNNNDSRTN